MITIEDLDKLKEFQEIVFDGVEKSLRIEGGHKSYEGAIAVHLPPYFGGYHFIELDCYVLGPRRHYEWTGKNLSEAIDKAMIDVKKWIKELEDE